MSSFVHKLQVLFILMLGLHVTPAHGQEYTIYTPQNPFTTKKAECRQAVVKALSNVADKATTAMTVSSSIACFSAAFISIGTILGVNENMDFFSRGLLWLTASTGLGIAGTWVMATCEATGRHFAGKISSSLLNIHTPESLSCDSHGIHLQLAQQSEAENTPYTLYDKQRHKREPQQLFIPKEMVKHMTYQAGNNMLVITTYETE